MPASLHTESAVLGAMLIDPDAVPIAMDRLTPSSFYHEWHERVFEAMRVCYRQHEPLNITTVFNRLNMMRLDVGGITFLAELADGVVNTGNMEEACRILRKKQTLRNLIRACQRTADEAYRDTGSVTALLAEHESQVFAISQADRALSPFQARSLSLDEYAGRADLLRGVSSGFSSIDALTNGFKHGDLWIVAGRPSMGKTALALNMAEKVALRGGGSVAFFSLEMSSDQLYDRLLCGHAGVSAAAMRRLSASETVIERLQDSAAALSDIKLTVFDTPILTVANMRGKLHKLRGNIALIVVDYLQLMDGEGESRQQQITQISRGLKSVAMELGVPVVALSQLNRALETRGGDKRPQLADLRESGAIEQDADVVMFVYRESHAFNRTINNHGRDISHDAEVIIAKQRNGPTGTVRLTFSPELARFEDAN
jgi:replicative DNA helicase